MDATIRPARAEDATTIAALHKHHAGDDVTLVI